MLLEYLAQDHISFIASLEPHVFLYILETISDGLTGQGSMPSNFTGQQQRKYRKALPYRVVCLTEFPPGGGGVAGREESSHLIVFGGFCFPVTVKILSPPAVILFTKQYFPLLFIQKP